MGIVFLLVAFPSIWLVLGSVDLALTVGIALFAASAVATVVAVTLPLLLHRLGRDPAFGSGPLATVVQDLLSLVIYFAVATLVTG
jgi:magnesium transporter